MNEETLGVEQVSLPPQGDHTGNGRPRIPQVGGQYGLGPSHVSLQTSQNHFSLMSSPMDISPSPLRSQVSPLRHNPGQSMSNVLKSRSSSNVRTQLFSTDVSPNSQNSLHYRGIKRSSSTTDKDTYASKLQHVTNHRIVRSKIVKEKYSEHLLELFYLEAGGNILDLYQYAKRPKSNACLNYLNEHAIDTGEYVDESPAPPPVQQMSHPTPSATDMSSLPGNTRIKPPRSPTPPRSSELPPTPDLHNYSQQPKIKTTPNQEHIVEKAKQEAYVVQRISNLQKEGLWSDRRLPRVQEMPRSKAHWDYLLEEMVWLAADFAQERKWKKAAAKKCARMVQKYFQDKSAAATKAEKAHEQNLKRIAAFCAKEVKSFWTNVKKLVEYKQYTILEEKRKKALDQQLSFIVNQTEKYSQLLAEGMNKPADAPSSNVSSRSMSVKHSDDEFEPDMQSDDDEETIAKEEADVSQVDQTEEVEALKRESQLELDDLLEDDFLRDYLLNRDNIKLDEDGSEDDQESKSETAASGKVTKSDSVDEESESEESSLDSESDSTEGTNTETKTYDLEELINGITKDGTDANTDPRDNIIDDAAAIAESIQPKGNTLSSTKVSTKVPFLLKFPLREYQHIGLDWLVTMFDRKLNGILADEMGLGKTIQTIALLAHLACEKGIWGPHLIVVPTSVMLNWEMELKKWCPAFKILTYYGTQKERKLKRTGWTKPNTFHVCITSYKLVIQDHQSFRRKRWQYLILDEAQNIKNFKSQRWQLLLNFQTERRLLLTGTPLQNNLMELWSLMHFLMPNVFQSHREFKEWFSNPVTGMIEGNSEYNESIIKRLHKVLRPFLLRRLKCEVEKQLPKKYEHVIMCRLSKRQRFLYDDYMSRAKTKETLETGNLLSVINILMQLRKVCNHPNLFEVRPTISPFQCDRIKIHFPSLAYELCQYDPFKHVNLYAMNFLFIMLEIHWGAYQCFRTSQSTQKQDVFLANAPEDPTCPPCKLSMQAKFKAQAIEDKSSDKKDLKSKNVTQQNVKMKVSGVQILSQGLIKTIPLVTNNSAHGQVTAALNVLKPSDKIATSFAQLVQTSTGKHLLLTSNPNVTGSSAITSTAGGQKFTFLSKKPITAMSGNSQAITKAFVKFQLTSVLPQTIVNSTAESDAKSEEKEKLQFLNKVNERKCSALPLYGRDFQNVFKIFNPNKVNSWTGGHIHCSNAVFEKHIEEQTRVLREAIFTPEQRIEELKGVSDRFILYVPAVKGGEPELRIWHPPPSEYWARQRENALIRQLFSKPATPLHSIASAMVTQFPDPRLIQYDCGKLQTLDKLLRNLKTDSHRVLIFTQMTKMLDVLEAFLNFHGHIYLRLDGSTKVEQRQVLMERFNNDKRIFVFILSTRSGGVGINLTGADTVIFYDSDWNPTMDAQAQDRCHRIGQTRDVHIYRLISERTIEENILKKANQKRQLGDLAIEGGNFTTAYFKSSSIQDLFNIDNSKETASQRLASYVESKQIEETPSSSKDSTTVPSTPVQPALSALESALAACEDDQDAQAAQSAKAEAAADLAEFDENIPLDQELPEKEPELSKAEQEINMIVEKLSPIERFAMNFIESNESALSAEQLAAAEREIEQQKQEWEQNHMAKMKEEEERRLKEMEQQSMEMLNYSREDASNQVWIADGSEEAMPMWCPPTPPHQETDVFLDNTVSFLYENKIMSESQLPPIYVKKELKRTRFEAGFGLDARRHLKIIRTEESSNAPRSLFYSPTISKLKKDIRMQKYRGLLHRPINAMNIQGKPNQKPVIEQPLFHDWTIHEDMALLKVLHTFQGLRLNLILVAPGQTPNWDFVADYVNTVSVTYRSAKQCKQRYENHLFQREEGRYTNSLENIMKKKKKIISPPMQHKFPFQKFSKPAKTSQLYTQDNNSTFTQVMIERFESIKHISSKRVTTSRTVVNNPLMNKSKNVLMLSECGIDVEHPILPVEVAARRAERLAKEKKTEQLTKLQLMKGIQQQHQQQQAQQQAQHQQQQQQIQGASSSIVSQLTSSSLPAVAASSNTQQPSTSIVPQQQQQQIPNVVISQSVVVSVPDTATTSNIRQSRVIASSLQTPTVVSVTGLTPVQLQATTQRIVVSPSVSGVQAKTVLATGQKQQFTQQQLQLIRQATMKQQPLRLHASALPPGSKLQTTAGGSPTVVQFSQGQPRAQFVRQSTVTVGNKTGVTRTVTESEVAQLLKKQHQLQQQKLAAAAIGAAGGSSQITTGTAGNVIHGVSSQVFAQALQQAGSTLVRASSSGSGVTQTLTIPMAGSSVSPVIAKGATQGLKVTAAQAQQLRHAQLQQQLLAQKKVAAGSKLSLTQIGNKSLQTQLIVGPKPLPTTMTVQQFQQVLRAPLNSAQGPVIVAKSPSRGIPVSLHGAKQSIQGAPVRIQTSTLPATLSTATTDTSQSDQSLHPQLAFIEKREKPPTQP